MNPINKRYLITIGALICLAIALIGIAEFLNHSSDDQSDKQFAYALRLMFFCAAFAFPLFGIVIYLLKKQEVAHLDSLRKSIAKSTREGYAHSLNIIEDTEAGTWDWNLLTDEVVFNERWAEIIGYTLKELEPCSIETWDEKLHPEDRIKTKLLVKQHLSGEIPYYNAEFRQLHKDGNWRWVNARGKVIEWSETGEPLRMSGTHLDITERKAATEAHGASRQLLKSIFDATSGVSVIATDLSGTITLFNTGAETMLGYSAQELLGQSTPFILHLESELAQRGIPLSIAKSEGFDAYMQHLLKAGRESNEWTYVCKNGRQFPVTLSITAIHDETGARTGYLGAAMDISERKQNEIKLNDSESLLRNVLDTIPVRVFWKDKDSRYLGANQLFAEDAGEATEGDIIGKKDNDFSWPEQAAAYQLDDAAVIASGESKLNYEYQQGRLDGCTCWVKTSKVPLRNSANEVIGVLGIYEDITAAKQTQAELIKAKEGAEAASKAKDDFLAIMGHEMRTPLNPILGFAELLRQNITTLPESDYIKTIITAANRQLRLIEDILQYMRINRGEIKLSMEVFNLVELCQIAVSDARVFAGSLKLSFVADSTVVDAAHNCWVLGDRAILRRIVDSLINNACKYTNEGGISVFLKQSDIPGCSFAIAIKDTGIGIDAQYQQKLFDAFSQTDSSYTRQYQGLGLGLAICKKLLSLLDSNITVQSKMGVGSTFTIHLSIKGVKEQTIQATNSAPRSRARKLTGPCHVLIADKQTEHRFIARSLLESYGCKVTEAIDGKEMSKLCKQTKYDVILIDLAIAQIDDTAVYNLIRNTTNQNQYTPMIAVTADMTPSVVADSVAADIQHCISKPVSSKTLFELINLYV
jgi:PAS domain S-box-containing protein